MSYFKLFAINVFFIVISMFIGCKSIELPTIEQSNKMIEIYRPQIETADRFIYEKTTSLPKGNDIILKIDISSANKILQSFAYNRVDDINLIFNKTEKFIIEEKSIGGLIKYTNHINIDTGSISLNLKSLSFTKFDNNKIDGKLEIEGKGKISVSGKYLEMPGSISPDVEFYLFDPVSFAISPTDSGYVLLKPMQKKITLKTKIHIQFFGWKVPWYQETPLELSEIMKPMALPVAMKSEVLFPIPSKKSGNEKIEYIPYEINLSKTNVNASGKFIEYRTNIDLNKKKN